MPNDDLAWAIPTMRTGYAGRGLTYVAVAGLSLWAVWHGGQAQGTSSTFAKLEHSIWGLAVLVLIGLGLLAYAVWRVTCAWYDLENRGDGGKGIVARAGQVTTGLIHGALGIGALLVAFTPKGGDDQSALAKGAAWLMSKPGGVILVGILGLVTIGAGIYYLHKGWSGGYRKRLMANRFTTRWNPVLKGGVMAQGFVVCVVGVFLLIAAWQTDPGEAGGLDKTFNWLSGQVYGQVLVTILCVGLLAFALFCFVNAAYRIVPRVSAHGGIETLAHRVQAMV